MSVDDQNGWQERASQDIEARPAAVIYPYLKNQSPSQTDESLVRSPEARLAEAVGLTEAIDLDVRLAETVPLSKIRPSTLIGSGKIEELKDSLHDAHIEVLIVDGTLSPVQQRNLERALKTKILDRTGLILEIFGNRARTREGVLQVELAHLEYQKTRLVRSWTHLERQRGGLGFVGGPGETQLEIDRRLINERIGRIKKEMSTVVRTRDLHRKNRARTPYPVVALVGYTNAGKSTLFNRLTGAEVMAKDMLFATLDPTMRAVELPGGHSVIFSDTVGFISELPTHLVAAFRATLEEVLAADVILIVSDVSHPDWEAQRADVVAVLSDLGVDMDSSQIPVMDVFNKVDAIQNEETASAMRNRGARSDAYAAVSALTGEGADALLAKIAVHMQPQLFSFKMTIPAADGALISWVYQHAVVNHEDTDGTNMIFDVELEAKTIGRLHQKAAHLIPEDILAEALGALRSKTSNNPSQNSSHAVSWSP